MDPKLETGFVDRYAPIWIAFVFTVAILIVCYPGFMSYDSLRTLEEARTQVRGGIFPAMPVYLMRLADFGGHGPTVLLVVQNFIVLLSLALILRFLAVRWWTALLAMMLTLAMPVALGVMFVVWKDVTTTAPLLLALVLIYWASRNPAAPGVPWAKWGSMLLLIVATLVRFNAFSATAVIAGYWTLSFYPMRNRMSQVCIFLAALLSMGASNKIVNGYTFPNFGRLAPNDLAFVVMNYDLVGISKWSGESLLPVTPLGNQTPKAKISDINSIYNSLGVVHINAANQVLGNPVKLTVPGYTNRDILRMWMYAIEKHPGAYIRYRLDLFEETIGAKPYATFEPTHFGKVDANELGIKFEDRFVTQMVLSYVEAASATTLGKPWSFLLFSIFSCVVLLRLRTIPRHFKTLGAVAFIAAATYLLPLFIMAGTGEVRYVYPTLILGSVPVYVLLFGRRSLSATEQGS